MRFAKGVAGVILGLFSAAPLLFGGYLLGARVRALFGDVYYIDYPYVIVGSLFFLGGLASLWSAYYAVNRRSFYGLLLLVPFLTGFVTLVAIPDAQPSTNSLMADANYISSVHSYMREWYERKGRFPANVDEFQKAMAQGPATWKSGAGAPESVYRQRGAPVSYQVEVERGAIGPRLTNISARPAVVYYRVSEDLQSYWVTLTGLNKRDVASAAELSKVGHGGEPRLVHAKGSDYTIRKD